MSPDIHPKPVKFAVASDIYTILLIIASATVLATFVFVAAKCYSLFGSLFSSL
jgi:hypothetical protein